MELGERKAWKSPQAVRHAWPRHHAIFAWAETSGGEEHAAKTADGAALPLAIIEPFLKWSIAYVPALLLVTGYFVDSAQRRLFGLDTPFEFNQAVASGLELIGDLATDLASTLEGLTKQSMDAALPFIVGIFLIVLAMIVGTTLLLRGWPAGRAAIVIRGTGTLAKHMTTRIGGLVALLILAPIAVVQAWYSVLPASRISDVLKTPTGDVRLPPNSVFARRANQMWQDFACAKGALAKGTVRFGVTCLNTPEVAHAKLKQMFGAFATLTILSILAGLAALKWNAIVNPNGLIVSSLLMLVAVWNFFSLPIVYGTIRKEPRIPFAQIVTKTELKPLGDLRLGGTVFGSDPVWVLSATDKVTRILVRTQLTCSAETGPSKKAETHVAWLKFDIANSEILALQYIESAQPLFQNVLNSETECATLPLPVNPPI